MNNQKKKLIRSIFAKRKEDKEIQKAIRLLDKMMEGKCSEYNPLCGRCIAERALETIKEYFDL